jgi:protocatechuate 3,4-dioxygenase beta subunit
MKTLTQLTRRRVVQLVGYASALVPFTTMAMESMKPTPAVSVGPFYPPDPSGLPFIGAQALNPLPQGNDLTRGANGRTAQGEHVRIDGRVLDTAGRPLAGTKVELWQVDARGHYAVETGADHDPGFGGYGISLTDADGRYTFTTIRPQGYARYWGLIERTAHIHMRVSASGRAPLATELWFAGERRNEGDTFVSRIRDAALRRRMLVRFEPGDGGLPIGVFDIVLPNK